MTETDSTSPPANTSHGVEVQRRVRLCECGEPACGRFMHIQVHGLFEWLCSDCLEEANLMETIYAEPCSSCRGNGSIMGEDCEDCEGSGRVDW